MELYECVNYRSDLKFVFSRYIREYDIKKANISILYKYGVLSREKYIELYNSTREKRQIEIGLMERANPEIYEILANGIIKAKKLLFLSNNINESSVLSIKNDAVFIIGEPLKYTEFGGIEFVNKNTYSTFVDLNKIEVYYGLDRVNSSEVIDVKGLGKNKELHSDFMTDFVVYILNSIETGDIEDAISSLTDFYKDYLDLKLNIGYYREYNSDSLYSFKNTHYKATYLNDTEYNKKCLDISYNINILRHLASCLSIAYFDKQK